jgi:hypothetical protein
VVPSFVDYSGCGVCSVPLLDSVTKTHKGVAVHLTVDWWPLGIPIN